MHGGPWDVGARLTRAFARPVGAITGTTVQEVLETVGTAPRSAWSVCLSSGMRAIAWFLFAGSALLLYLAISIVEDVTLDRRTVIGDWGGAPTIVAAFAGGLSALRCGVTYYVSDALWERGGRVLRWALAPGNKDFLVALVIASLGAVAISA